MNEPRPRDSRPAGLPAGATWRGLTRCLVAAGCLSLCCAVAPVAALSAPTPKTDFPTGPTRVEKVIEEIAYYYRLRPYEPAVEVRPTTREGARYDTPEAAAIAGISAMLSGNYAWFLDTWTPEARQAFEKRNAELGRGPEFWTEAWARAFAGKRVELTHRIETGRYVLVAYTLVDPNTPPAPPDEETGVRRPFLTTVLIEQDGRWLATQDLGADPVLMFWDHPGYRVQKTGRGLEAH